MANQVVIQGNNTPTTGITITGYTVESADWTGLVIVAEKLGETALISRAMVKAADNSKFLAYLTPAETLTLSVGTTYSVTYRVINTTMTPPITREFHNKVLIEAKG